jgi:hypothetical protein
MHLFGGGMMPSKTDLSVVTVDADDDVDVLTTFSSTLTKFLLTTSAFKKSAELKERVLPPYAA